jgi:hypothetical protein
MKGKNMIGFINIILISLMFFILSGCPGMEPVELKLKLKNSSDLKITVLMNFSFPDTTLKKSVIEGYIDPKSEKYLARTKSLDRYSGLTIILYENSYFDSKWNENVGTPDTYLEEDKILKKYIYTKNELENMGWTIAYP